MALFIGRLPPGIKDYDLEDIFIKYGKITRCEVKKGKSFYYGFVEFDNDNDAYDAMDEVDGMDLDGVRIIVEKAKGRVRRSDERGCYNCGEEGHYARDCRERPRSRHRSRSRSPSRSRGRRYRSYSRSPSPRRRRYRSYSRSPSPDRRRRRRRSYSPSVSRSPPRRRRSSYRDDRSYSRSRSRSYSRSISRSISPVERRRRMDSKSRSRSPSRDNIKEPYNDGDNRRSASPMPDENVEPEQ
ncbi:uncharacterized protein BX664DRAFT_324160 [Halteromyces radiatus]|uniref:uncharacterized protein n=1 Tax=Halteromyces radiatus TaxID=101107 RepID=UPI00221F271E|nr:uncharacterized protein BX664DRAFT_324160 [Halteromyces radiatus]KAI8096511.1 hypothetical protein BX664DRAFT_324160 [Halteromyces radiatus]